MKIMSFLDKTVMLPSSHLFVPIITQCHMLLFPVTAEGMGLTTSQGRLKPFDYMNCILKITC